MESSEGSVHMAQCIFHVQFNFISTILIAAQVVVKQHSSKITFSDRNMKLKVWLENCGGVFLCVCTSPSQIVDHFQFPIPIPTTEQNQPANSNHRINYMHMGQLPRYMVLVAMALARRPLLSLFQLMTFLSVTNEGTATSQHARQIVS